MSQIAINDLVLEESRTDKYQIIRDKMEKNLACPDKVNRYVVHESGHFFYLFETGLIVDPHDAVFAGPTIYEEDGLVCAYNAGVTSEQIRLSNETLEYTEPLLDKIALVAAAAGEFERALLGADEETETAIRGDEATLHQHCKAALKRNDIPFEAFSLWPKAQETVVKYIKENRSAIDDRMEVIKPLILYRCFGITKAP